MNSCPCLELETLRRYALARSLFAPTTLPQALARLGFVQADPLRAPARAQDLILYQRVRHYRAGQLEQHYPRLAVAEDFFVNYGFVVPQLQALMHPRQPRKVWSAEHAALAQEVLAHVQHAGSAHPKDVDAALQHGRVSNWFGGSSRLSTELLDALHYRGALRVVRRDAGTRVYAPAPPWPGVAEPQQAMDQLLDAVVALYAPLTRRSLGQLLSHLGGGAPQWEHLRSATLKRALQRLPSAEVAGQQWFWPVGEAPRALARRWRGAQRVRLLAPFDPVVWDRQRFELFWGWAYRFEAYTPAAQRQRGHYALPLLWGEEVIGWGNLRVQDGRLHAQLGYVSGQAPRTPGYAAALQQELAGMAVFLGATSIATC
ncbi:DNA glycosylase AlkZ-like family protein [Roseateles sp. BYS180W]|uniref:DNA glycosylase AlkZ-like family protein n=1 Tax=Roseateles rivi TaxID=3299028 RepID=A0ABW7FQZ2_9BURK